MKNNDKGLVGAIIIFLIIIIFVAISLVKCGGNFIIGKIRGMKSDNAKKAVYIDVTVEGSKYNYNGGEYKLSSLIDVIIDMQKKLNKEGMSLKVRISENEGLKKAYNKLVKKLEENGIEYIDNTG